MNEDLAILMAELIHTLSDEIDNIAEFRSDLRRVREQAKADTIKNF